MNNSKGYHLSKETIERMKKNRKGMLGKNHSLKTKEKISYSLKKKAYDLLRRRKLSDAEIDKLKRKLIKKSDYERIKELRSRKGYNRNNQAVKLAYKRICNEIPKLEEEGYKCIPIGKIIPDIIAIKKGKIYAFEVEYGKPNYKKYDKDDYYKKFHKVIWIIKNNKYVNHN